MPSDAERAANMLVKTVRLNGGDRVTVPACNLVGGHRDHAFLVSVAQIASAMFAENRGGRLMKATYDDETDDIVVVPCGNIS